MQNHRGTLSIVGYGRGSVLISKTGQLGHNFSDVGGRKTVLSLQTDHVVMAYLCGVQPRV